MKNVILISGKMCSGKDYTAKLLQKFLQNKGYRVGILHFGDAVKMVSKSLYEWSGEKDEIGRHILQYVGTEIGREYNKNIWVDIISIIINMAYNDFDFILIPDTRFKNEADYRFIVPSYRIRIDGCLPDLSDPPTHHLSENDLDEYSRFDLYIPNYPYLSEDNFNKFFSKICKDLGV